MHQLRNTLPAGALGRAMTSLPIIIGLGSSHGDDQAGWLVIDRLHQRGVPETSARAIANPSELWTWCQRDRPLTICDAILNGAPVGSAKQWSWPSKQFDDRFSGTHDLSLAEVMTLGAELGLLPTTAIVWTITASACVPGTGPSPSVSRAAEVLADRLYEEQCGA